MVFPFRQSACGICLRDGSLAIGISAVVGTCIGMIAYVAYLKGRVQDFFTTKQETFPLYLEIAIMCALLAMDIILIMGVFTEREDLLLAWLVAHAVYGLFLFVKFALAFYAAVATVEVLYAMGVLIFYSALLCLLVYALLVVYSYRFELVYGLDGSSSCSMEEGGR